MSETTAPKDVKKTSISEKVKKVIYIAVAVFAAIVIFKNRDDVKTDFVLFTIEMPRWLALLGATSIGFLLGAVFGKRLMPGGKK